MSCTWNLDKSHIEDLVVSHSSVPFSRDEVEMSQDKPVNFHLSKKTPRSDLSQCVSLYDGRMAIHKLNILIIGGGISGIAAAFCLGKAGHDITVAEAAPAISEVGAGIQVGPSNIQLGNRR
jgi:NADPH-dependent 2,4-dienoyl-CoA reductase/sulfur reductase-like enzyme